jgi:hypothetical protein
MLQTMLNDRQMEIAQLKIDGVERWWLVSGARLQCDLSGNTITAQYSIGGISRLPAVW